MVFEEDRIEYHDKFPQILPNVPPEVKYEILRCLIREEWPDGTVVVAKWTDDSRLAVKFELPEPRKECNMRYYHPGIGRFLARDMMAQAVALGKILPKELLNEDTNPLVQHSNSYSYCDSEPAMYVDPLGFYKIQWSGEMKGGERNMIAASLARVRLRIETIIKQAETTLQQYAYCSNCYEKPISMLKRLLQVLRGVMNRIDSPKEKLIVSKGDFGEAQGAQILLETWYANAELQLNTNKTQNWFGKRKSERDEEILHELTHQEGTKDLDVNPGNNPHDISQLIEQNVHLWATFREAMLKAADDVKNGKCCCTGETHTLA
jgi:RHS repeat-associated protein